MEWWGHAIYLNTPILQYSNTPKMFATHVAYSDPKITTAPLVVGRPRQD
jgi:hypothetical protein